MAAFVTSIPLRRPARSARQAESNSLSPRRAVASATAGARTEPKRGKRVSSYKKHQRRHRAGPAVFRQNTAEAAEASAQEAEKAAADASASPSASPRRARTGREGIPLRDLTVGQPLPGVVQNLVPHGAFVDVGASRDGLVHVRDISVDFVYAPFDVVRSGMQVDTWVKYVDPVRDVLALTMVRPERGFEGRVALADIVEGSRHRAVVERVTNYGAYLDIGAERLAFLHVSGVWGEHPRETLEYMRLGDRVWVHVAAVDPVKGHIKLLASTVDKQRLTEESPIGDLVIPRSVDAVPEGAAVARPWNDVDDGRDSGDGISEGEFDEDDAGADVDEDMDEEADEYEDEFAFENDMLRTVIGSESLDGIEHMFTQDTEFVDK